MVPLCSSQYKNFQHLTGSLGDRNNTGIIWFTPELGSWDFRHEIKRRKLRQRHNKNIYKYIRSSPKVFSNKHKILKKPNSVAWVRERTIPTERLQLVGEVSANFYEWREPRGQRNESLRPYSQIGHKILEKIFYFLKFTYSNLYNIKK
jgi:hypothetical protein